TSQAPESGPAPLPPQPQFVQGEQRSPEGEPVLVSTPTPTTPFIPPFQSGTGYAIADAYDGFEGSLLPATVTFNASGQLTSYGYVDTFYGYSWSYELAPGGTQAEFGTDGILAWGRWTGDVNFCSSGEGCFLWANYGPNQGLHYIVGMPTEVMPTTGDATYTLIGATRPTFSDGSATTGSFTGSLYVNYATGSINLTGANVVVGSNQYALGTNPGYIYGSQFYMYPTVTHTGSHCTSGCYAGVEGFFAGANAARAGMAYSIVDWMEPGKDVSGVAAFAR
ncbi:MAG TPA: hypothetical protein VM489_15940, partial [Burkholderiales bacterium]|nr:hypothetical protein [Burkholderiales bacterium]